jgi:hypothetical protein
MLVTVHVMCVEDDIAVESAAQRIRLNPSRRTLIIEFDAQTVGCGETDDLKMGTRFA